MGPVVADQGEFAAMLACRMWPPRCRHSCPLGAPEELLCSCRHSIASLILILIITRQCCTNFIFLSTQVAALHAHVWLSFA